MAITNTTSKGIEIVRTEGSNVTKARLLNSGSDLVLQFIDANNRTTTINLSDIKTTSGDNNLSGGDNNLSGGDNNLSGRVDALEDRVGTAQIASYSDITTACKAILEMIGDGFSKNNTIATNVDTIADSIGAGFDQDNTIASAIQTLRDSIGDATEPADGTVRFQINLLANIVGEGITDTTLTEALQTAQEDIQTAQDTADKAQESAEDLSDIIGEGLKDKTLTEAIISVTTILNTLIKDLPEGSEDIVNVVADLQAQINELVAFTGIGYGFQYGPLGYAVTDLYDLLGERYRLSNIDENGDQITVERDFNKLSEQLAFDEIPTDKYGTPLTVAQAISAVEKQIVNPNLLINPTFAIQQHGSNALGADMTCNQAAGEKMNWAGIITESIDGYAHYNRNEKNSYWLCDRWHIYANFQVKSDGTKSNDVTKLKFTATRDENDCAITLYNDYITDTASERIIMRQLVDSTVYNQWLGNEMTFSALVNPGIYDSKGKWIRWDDTPTRLSVTFTLSSQNLNPLQTVAAVTIINKTSRQQQTDLRIYAANKLDSNGQPLLAFDFYVRGAQTSLNNNNVIIGGDRLKIYKTKVEYGIRASTIQPIDYDTELVKCKRYYQIIDNTYLPQVRFNKNIWAWLVHMSYPMCRVPTCTIKPLGDESADIYLVTGQTGLRILPSKDAMNQGKWLWTTPIVTTTSLTIATTPTTNSDCFDDDSSTQYNNVDLTTLPCVECQLRQGTNAIICDAEYT